MRTLLSFALLGCVSLVIANGLASSAFGITELKREWASAYLGDSASDEYKAAAKKASCYVCHVKGKEKKDEDGRNEYGVMMIKFLKSKKMTIDDLKKEYKNESTKEAAKKKIRYMFDKVGEQKSKDGERFIDKIRANKLPATDAGL